MPNGTTALGDLIQAARERRGWTKVRLARELGMAEGGGPDRLDGKAVRRWEQGTRVPRYWLAHLVEVLELDLDQVAHVPRGRMTPPGPTTTGDTVTSVIELARSDVDRRAFVATGAYALSVLALPDPEALTRRTATARGRATVGRGEVDAVRAMTTALGDAAAEHGGGHARHLAVRYLATDVAPWLEGKYTAATGRALYAATAELAHLAGWMAADEGHQGLAQRYYGHSYRLASEAGDAETAATALRGLAVQALALGHHGAALRLSEACVAHAKALDDPRATAYYQATLANAAAHDRDAPTATRALRRSEQAIDRAPATPGASWAAHYSPGRWAHESGLIHARLGDLDAAEEHLRLALDIHGLDRRRTRAIVLADLAALHLRRGDTEAALTSWDSFLTTAAGVRSVKVDEARTDMQARLSRVPDPRAADLVRRVEA
ncbi:helix-turn-helix domain-containing protein [Streptomyces sp. NPDC059740]|uniref:helix-turn-helix domain-containing protein n=1 Tax=Streptomyces sp. NPDC059740 TaxID=3346926 RepID=UPI00365156BA